MAATRPLGRTQKFLDPTLFFLGFQNLLGWGRYNTIESEIEWTSIESHEGSPSGVRVNLGLALLCIPMNKVDYE
jgi:hypothetical protein